MSGPGLINKYRPSEHDQVWGQANAVAILAGQANRAPEDRSHAILFKGHTGCGKTTLARIQAALYGAVEGSPDFVDMNAAKSRGIDDIRNIQSSATMAPMGGTARIWIIDECQMLTKEAQSALLKTVEEPVVTTYFFLCTTDPQKLLPTLRGRCLEVDLEPVSTENLVGLMGGILEAEGIVTTEPVLMKIAEVADGSPRKCLTILDAIRDIPDEPEQLKVVGKLATKTAAIEIARALLGKTDWATMARILLALDKDEDVEGIRHMVLAYCNTILTRGAINGRAFQVMCEFSRPFYDTKRAGLTMACYAVVVPPA